MSTSTAARVRTRPEIPADSDFTRELFDDAKAPEFEDAGLAPAVVAQLLDLQYRARSAHYAVAHPTAEALVIDVDGAPAGRALVERSASTIHLVDLAVLTAQRRRGAATHLLRELADEAHSGGQELRLRVRTDNAPARALYERFGFVVVGESAGDLLLTRASGSGRVAGEAETG